MWIPVAVISAGTAKTGETEQREVKVFIVKMIKIPQLNNNDVIILNN